jgi:formylglycine-generating enzyme required for sulfatase activity
LLSECTGEWGHGTRCTAVALSTVTAYECTGYRLPTETEWEYAALAGTRTAFYTGDLTVADPMASDVSEANLEPIAWYSANAGGNVLPVGRKRPNRWGLCDVLGNVWEWTDQWAYAADPAGPTMDPVAFVSSRPESTDARVIRGGCGECAPHMLRVAGRSYRTPGQGDQYSGLGIRLVRTLPAESE